MIVLGIETSCDETSVSIVERKKNTQFGEILSEQTLSQINKHQKFGGVVPELASREHSKHLDYLVKKSVKSAKIKFDEIGAVYEFYNDDELINNVVKDLVDGKAVGF